MYIVAYLGSEFETYNLIERIIGYNNDLDKAKKLCLENEDSVIINLNEKQVGNRFDRFYCYDYNLKDWFYDYTGIMNYLKMQYEKLKDKNKEFFHKIFGYLDNIPTDKIDKALELIEGQLKKDKLG